MSKINADDVVISYWALGPTFVNYLNKNLEDSLSKYPEFFKFTILTDNVDACSYWLEKTPKCLAVIDINEARKNYPWSFELERIPSGKTDKEYTTEFQSNLQLGHKFSYSLHRFALPWFIENNITNIFFLDPDVHLTMDHPLPEHNAQLYVDTYLNEGTPPYLITDEPNYMVGQSAYPCHEKLHNDYYRILKEKMNLPKEHPEYFYSTDGPVRFYHFENVDMVRLFFETWNSAVKIMLEEPEMRYNGHGGVFFNDEVLLPCVYHILDIKLSTLTHTAATARHRIENRYFMPSFGNYKLTDSYEEFLLINQEELKIHHHDVELFDFPKRTI